MGVVQESLCAMKNLVVEMSVIDETFRGNVFSIQICYSVVAYLSLKRTA